MQKHCDITNLSIIHSASVIYLPFYIQNCSDSSVNRDKDV